MDRGRLLEHGCGHSELNAFVGQALAVVGADPGVLFRVQDGATAVLDAEQVAGLDLVLRALFEDAAPVAARAAPVVDDAERAVADVEVLVEPAPTTRRGGDQPAVLVLLDFDLVALVGLPGSRAK